MLCVPVRTVRPYLQLHASCFLREIKTIFFIIPFTLLNLELCNETTKIQSSITVIAWGLLRWTKMNASGFSSRPAVVHLKEWIGFNREHILHFKIRSIKMGDDYQLFSNLSWMFIQPTLTHMKSSCFNRQTFLQTQEKANAMYYLRKYHSCRVGGTKGDN